MLQKIRDNTQGLLAKIFIGFIIAVFALFGIESIVGTFMASTTVLSVNGVDISDVEIESLTQEKAQEFFANLGENADLSGFSEELFRESAVNELIQRELLIQSATGSNMAVSAVSLDRQIAQTPDFQIDGVFNSERASLLLRNLGYSPASYRAALAREKMLNQLLAAYSATGFTTPAEIARLAALTHQKRSFRYLTLGLEGQADGIEISEEQINGYYQEHQDDFIREEQVIIEYLELDKNAMLSEVDVTEEEILALYEEERASFQAQTERRASHILFEAASEEEFASALATAETVKGRLDAGEDFGALALEFSADTGSAEAGGDVGYTTGSNFVAEFETALQALAVGEVSAPVRTEFGIHLIKLTEQSDTEIPTFEERRAALESQLRSEEADTIFLARSEELSNLVFEAVDLDEPASSMGLEKQRSDWFGRSGGIGITALGGVINAAFSTDVLEDGLNSELIRLDDSHSVVIRVVEHQLPEVMPLAEVSGEIEVLLRLEQAREQVRLVGETIASSMQSGANIDGLLAAQNASWNQVDAIERSAPGANPEITDKVFTMARPAPGASAIAGYQLADGTYIVIELQSVTDGTAADFLEGEEGNMRNFVNQQMAANDFSGFMAGLEARAKIVGREQLLPADEDF
jgi:peptidyl-prolyl cis-trans isomerase D